MGDKTKIEWKAFCQSESEYQWDQRSDMRFPFYDHLGIVYATNRIIMVNIFDASEVVNAVPCESIKGLPKNCTDQLHQVQSKQCTETMVKFTEPSGEWSLHWEAPEKCDVCNGVGQFLTHKEWSDCPACHGEGWPMGYLPARTQKVEVCGVILGLFTAYLISQIPNVRVGAIELPHHKKESIEGDNLKSLQFVSDVCKGIACGCLY